MVNVMISASEKARKAAVAARRACRAAVDDARAVEAKNQVNWLSDKEMDKLLNDLTAAVGAMEAAGKAVEVAGEAAAPTEGKGSKRRTFIGRMLSSRATRTPNNTVVEDEAVGEKEEEWVKVERKMINMFANLKNAEAHVHAIANQAQTKRGTGWLGAMWRRRRRLRVTTMP